MNIKERLHRILATLPDGVKLVAVSKFHPAEAVEEAYNAGQRIFGESRPQEMAAKAKVLPKDIEWVMIGHLQTNKVKMIAPFVSLVASADSERLIEEIEKQAAKNERTIDILLEVHIADEESKSGWSLSELREYLASGALERMEHIRVRGVMTIATNTDDEAIIRRDFNNIRTIFEELKPRFGEAFDTLSIGMSDDYPIALEYGSTMVRIGTAIFGHRVYN
ncbi:MAG: YggS family pyridoxal phosphate-dependent enzyme [Alistipes sp.]|nr:YggS family pyridoxal phosphate-dependent enzyme [Alistipes sp.]MBQ5828950.1 YggS family pyridoxal phosphate-dependent enzyme [Alistipes sp.]